jgi:hypothetical protein
MARKSNPYRVEICPVADTEHLKSKRQYAHTYHHDNVICVANAFCGLPLENRAGIMLHEVGHLVAGPKAGEKKTNDVIEQKTGVRIDYRDGVGGKQLEWISQSDLGKATDFMSGYVQKPNGKRRNSVGLDAIIGSTIGSAIGSSVVQKGFHLADKATRTIMKSNRKRKRNTVAASELAYAGFHGREPEFDTYIETPIHEHKNLPAIGELCWLVIRCQDEDGEDYDVRLEDFDGAFLCMNEQRNTYPQLFIEGGDQGVDLKEFEIGPPLHENETLGRLVCVAYYTTKDHLGEKDGGEAEYVHVIEPPLDDDEFDEWGLKELDMTWDDVEEETEGSTGPDVIYDTRNHLLLLSGGSYSLPDEGIDH